MNSITRIIFLSLFIVAAAANGRAQTRELPPEPLRVQVTLTEWTISMPDRLPAGEIVFQIVNVGTMRHSFVLGGQGILLKLRQPLASGQRAELSATLTPGEYTDIARSATMI